MKIKCFFILILFFNKIVVLHVNFSGQKKPEHCLKDRTRCAVKVARTVLRGERVSNGSLLPDMSKKEHKQTKIRRKKFNRIMRVKRVNFTTFFAKNKTIKEPF